MLDDTGVAIAAAIAVLITPFPFFAAIAMAIAERKRRGAVGSRMGEIVAFTGGLALGASLLYATDLSLLIPVLGVPLAIVILRWRAGRRSQAGWLLAGLALPWTVLWSVYGSRLVTGSPLAVPPLTPGALALGAGALAIGLALARRGDPAPPPPSAAAPPGQPGSRATGSIAAAIREPSGIGPFGQPEIALLVALVVTLIVVPFLLPADASDIVRLGVSSLLGAVIATEAYVRAFPARSRRAFEAFSWLGERELARWRRSGGGRVPTNAAAADRWLVAHQADRPGDGARAEVLLLAGRIDDARAVVDRMPHATPLECFAKAATFDLVDWRAGGDGDLPAMEHAAAAILPEDGDDRLEAQVNIAVAKVRRLMADGHPSAGDAIEPFLEVRSRLGHRADGQVGRALRPRLIPVLLVSLLVVGVLLQLFGSTNVVPL